MKVIISGSSGLIGKALKESLEADDYIVKCLPRNLPGQIDFQDVRAVINLSGEPIASGRWTKKKKQQIEESRIGRTEELVNHIKNSDSRPDVFINASAIGYYGDRHDEDITEMSKPGSGFLSTVCKKWENVASELDSLGIRTVYARTGIVLSRRGGALQKMLLPFKLGGGGIVGTGSQYMSWISIDDEISAIRFLIDNNEAKGPFNLVSPSPVTNSVFTKTLGKVLKRPTFIPLPAFAARILFGEMAEALLLSSTRVYPKKLIEMGYAFKHPALEMALGSILT
ncbi:MAG: TIGR01777 family oxidoreductase [Pontiellaceae bacterium]|nr:TIGR01777 family oxidoreductase [Pontiellaceae bacterium]MBN2786127.1 TIGR01777 family oxidoreductase [Pontiellaceae bacterium]